MEAKGRAKKCSLLASDRPPRTWTRIHILQQDCPTIQSPQTAAKKNPKIKLVRSFLSVTALRSRQSSKNECRGNKQKSKESF